MAARNCFHEILSSAELYDLCYRMKGPDVCV